MGINLIFAVFADTTASAKLFNENFQRPCPTSARPYTVMEPRNLFNENLSPIRYAVCFRGTTYTPANTVHYFKSFFLICAVVYISYLYSIYGQKAQTGSNPNLSIFFVSLQVKWRPSAPSTGAQPVSCPSSSIITYVQCIRMYTYLYNNVAIQGSP